MNQREYQTLILAGLLHDIGKLLNKPEPEKGKKHAEYGYDFLRQADVASLLQQEKFDLDLDALCDLVLFHDPRAGGDRKPEVPAALLRIIRGADGYSAGERSLTHLYGRAATGDLPLDTIFTRRALGRPLPDARPLYKPAVLSPRAAFPEPGLASLTVGDYAPLQAGFEEAYRYALSQSRDWAQLEAWTYSLLERYTWAVPSAVHKDPRDVSLFDHARTSCAIAAAMYLYRGHRKEDRGRTTFLLVKGDVSGVQDYLYSVANVGPGGVAKRLRARSFFITALTETVAHRLRDELVEGFKLPIAASIFAGGGQFVLLVPNLKSSGDVLARIEREVNQWLWDEFQGDLAVVFGVEPVGGSQLAVKKRKKGRNICQVLGALERTVEAAKQQRLGTLLQTEDAQGNRAWQEDAFQWKADSYENGDCPSCKRLPARAGEEAEVDERLCHHCYRDRVLSEQIVGAHYIAYYDGESPPEPLPNLSERDADRLRSSQLSLFKGHAARHVVLFASLDDLERLDRLPYQLDGFGYSVPLQDRDDEAELLPLVRHFANHVPRFMSSAELESFCTGERGCGEVHFSQCGILERPGKRDVVYPILRTFGCISAAAAEWPGDDDAPPFYGSQLLGVLRADADHLGRLFTDSFEEEVKLSKNADPETLPVKSLSRLATLSRMTDLFFSGWVNQTLENPPDGKRYDLIYTVYAGGDDLCLVGPWDVLVDFTRHMAAEFRRYVAGNPNVTLSAAIAITKPKFPIATSARKAGELLKAAKDAGRNRLNLFGVITRWSEAPDDWQNLDPDLGRRLDEQRKHAMLLLDEQLWPWAELLDDELRCWREAKSARYPVSTAFTHRLLDYAEMARRWEQEEQITAEDMLYLARLAYDLGRNVVKSDAVSDDTKHRLTRLTQLSNKEVMAGMRLPITYALYRNRKRSRER